MDQDVSSNQELSGELEFMAAMQAYRKAQASGDAQAIARAERAWQDVVRGELQGSAHQAS